MESTIYRDEMLNEPERLSPGAILKSAREKKGFSYDHIAHSLDLSKEEVIALEHDDYTYSSGSLFTRGCLRSYAALLNLPEDEVIQRFEHLEASRHRYSRAEIAEAKPIERISHSDHVHWVTYLIGLAVLILAVMWWQTKTSIMQNMMKKPEQIVSHIEKINHSIAQAIQRHPPRHLAMDEDRKTV